MQVIKPLTSLRFLFALMVFVSHFDFNEFEGGTLIRWLYDTTFKECGELGVSFFFILSGFILAYKYEQRFLLRKTSVRDFLIARFARIYPLHLITFLIAIPIWIALVGYSNEVLWYSGLANLTLTQTLIPDRDFYFSYNSPAWSISVEAFFYLIFPAIIYFLSRKNARRILWLCIPAAAVCLYGIYILLPAETIAKYGEWIFRIFPLTRLVNFITGILLFGLYKKAGTLTRRQGNLIEYGSILLFIAFFIPHTHVPLSVKAFYYWVPMSAIILAFSFQRGYISGLISHRVFLMLGEISFAFYLIHVLVIRTYLSSGFKLDNPYLLLLTLGVVTGGLSFLAHYKLELPVNKWIKDRFQKKRKRTISPRAWESWRAADGRQRLAVETSAGQQERD